MPTTVLEMVAPGSLERLDRSGQSWKSLCIVNTVQVLNTLYFAGIVELLKTFVRIVQRPARFSFLENSREFFFIFTSRSRSRAVSISLSLLEKE